MSIELFEPDDQTLFNFINTYGDAYWAEDFCIIDNTGEYGRKNGEKHYRVFVKGGVSFDISKEILGDLPGQFGYCYLSGWEGPYGVMNSTNALKVLRMLGYGDKIDRVSAGQKITEKA